MGGPRGNRKRGEDYYTLNRKNPSLHSLDLDIRIDNRAAKKPKTSSSVHLLTPERPVSLECVASRISRYPKPVNLIRREVHAPCRVSKVGFGAKSNRKARPSMGSHLSFFHYDRVKNGVINTLRYLTNDEEVIDVDGETGNGDVSDNSSVEEVDGVEEGREGCSAASDKGSRETSAVVRNFAELGGKVAERNFQPSSSSVVSESANANLKAEKTGRMLDSLSLNGDVDASGLPTHKKLHETAQRRNPNLSKLKFLIDFTEKCLARWQLLRPVKKQEEDVLQEVLREPFVPLTEEEEAEVSRAFSSSNRRKVLTTHENSNIEITGQLLLCLRPHAWLNDEVINVYLGLLKEREKREPKKFLKCHFFNTFFYGKLIGGRNGYHFESVRRWTTQRKLGYCLIDCDKIFVPIHKEIHWCLAVINKKDEKFQYLDSLGGIDTQVLEVLARYLVDEVKDKGGKDIDVSSWKQEYVADLPRQKNGYDCGVFMIKYADFYSRGLGLCFNQEHMPYFRQRTAKELLRLKAE